MQPESAVTCAASDSEIETTVVKVLWESYALQLQHTCGREVQSCKGTANAQPSGLTNEVEALSIALCQPVLHLSYLDIIRLVSLICHFSTPRSVISVETHETM